MRSPFVHPLECKYTPLVHPRGAYFARRSDDHKTAVTLKNVPFFGIEKYTAPMYAHNEHQSKQSHKHAKYKAFHMRITVIMRTQTSVLMCYHA